MPPPRKPKAPSEWLTRKRQIDPALDACGWRLPKSGTHPPAYRTEEEPTDKGPADYALWLDGHVAGIVEAKKPALDPQNVLTQARRYAGALPQRTYNFDGLRCPFLYATNGETIWFLDVRHPLNRARTVANYHTTAALREMLDRDFDAACSKLRSLPNEHKKLRPYQKKANEGIEAAIADKRERKLLVAMATGTGKTFTMVNQVHRLMKSGVAKRVLFLVDRRALAAQAARAFAAFETAPGLRFDKDYEVYTDKLRKDDLGEDEDSAPFDPKEMNPSYLTNPKPEHAFVYISTIQRMAIYVLGRQAVLGDGDEGDDGEVDPDAGKLDIPIHAFDLIVADECHRGYTSAEESVWRSTLDHFDAIKIGLTATPAKHTTAYFTYKAAEYKFEDAVRDGYLVDYDAVKLRSDVRINGVFLKPGEKVELIDPETGRRTLDQVEDARDFDFKQVERKITSPDSNEKILTEIKTYADEHERQHGRFPKTLIFAVNDRPHQSHADQLVDIAKRVFARGDAFVEKITGRADRPLQSIRKFRNRPNPAIVVTVDLLTTGVDIPDLEYIVFLRPVQSRILFDQMLGRGTRKGEKYPNKDRFVVFDCFDGTLLAFFKDATDMEPELPEKAPETIKDLIDAIWDNRDRDYHTRALVKRLQRIDKAMSGEARDLFAAYIPDGDLAAWARNLEGALKREFVGTMKLLRDRAFQELLITYPRPKPTFLVARETTDTVTSEWLVRDGRGNEHKPQDYLTLFAAFVRDNPDHIEAVRILLDRPRDWSADALSELRRKLEANPLRFSEENLRKAHKVAYGRDLVDIISMVKHAADAQAPLLTAAERVERAFAKFTAGKTFSADQQKWLDRIKAHLMQNLSIDRDDFEYIPIFTNHGGIAVVRNVFPRLDDLLHELNEAVAA